jgi:hypothetical protein
MTKPSPARMSDLRTLVWGGSIERKRFDLLAKAGLAVAVETIPQLVPSRGKYPRCVGYMVRGHLTPAGNAALSLV